MSVLNRKLRRDVRQQWPQFSAISVTVLLGVALFAASYDAYRNLDASYEQLFEDTRFADLWVTGGDVEVFAEQAAGRRDVAAVDIRVEADVPLRLDGVELRGRVVGMPAGSQPPVNGLVVLDGALRSEATKAALEQHAADEFGIEPGGTVAARGPEGWRELDVTATVASTEYLWPARSRFEILTPPRDFAVLWATDPVAEQLAGHGPNQAVVRLAADAEASALDELEQLATQHGARQVLTRAEQPSNSILQEDINGLSQMSIVFPLLFLTAAGMATYVLLTRRVQSERQIVGTLLASGVGRGAILQHYLAYGIAAALVGAMLGVGLGIALAGWLTGVYTSFIDLPLSVIELRAETVGIGIAFALVAGSLASLVPARAAAATPPTEAMRGPVPKTGGGRTLVERLVPPLGRAPASWRLVLRNIARNPRRTAYTMIGTVLALLLVLTSLGLLSSVNAMLDRQFEQVQREDGRVELAADADGTFGQLRGVDGVTAVERFAELPTAITHDGATFGTALRVFEAGTGMHGFRAPDGTFRSLPPDGLLLGRAAAEDVGADTGDEVWLVGPAWHSPVSMTIAGLVDEPLGTFAYAAFPAIEDAGGTAVESREALVQLADAADAEAVRAELTAIDSVVAYGSIQATQDMVQDFMGLFCAFVGGMVVLGAIMGFAIMFTTMSVNIVERSRDIATLRASGVHASTIGRLITSENMLVTLAAVVPGAVVGILGGRAMLETFSNEQFSIDFAITPVMVLIPVATLLVVAFVSQWPSLRMVQRLDIAEVVRERQS